MKELTFIYNSLQKDIRDNILYKKETKQIQIN